MKLKFWTKLSFYLIFLGWFPFMWVCAWGMWQVDYVRIIIVLSGLLLCLCGGVLMTSLLHDDFLFKSAEELLEEKQKYINATKRLNQKIREL